jgi:hypothetical protein
MALWLSCACVTVDQPSKITKTAAAKCLRDMIVPPQGHRAREAAMHDPRCQPSRDDFRILIVAHLDIRIQMVQNILPRFGTFFKSNSGFKFSSLISR